jgi:hypothetical protein
MPPSSSAATGTAEEGSMSSLQSSSTTRIACTIAASLTVTTSSTSARSSAKFRRPIVPRRPSASVSRGPPVSRTPLWNERAASAAAAGSAPITRHPGSAPRAASAVPPMRPPPPIGAITTASVGTAQRSSRAAVPWPAMTCASSNGWTSRLSGSCSSSRATAASRAAMPGAHRSIVAPARRTASSFQAEASSGITTVAASPSERAASASAAP